MEGKKHFFGRRIKVKKLPAGEGGLAVLAAVLFVASVELDVPISGSLVLKEAEAKIAPERHFVAVSLMRNF